MRVMEPLLIFETFNILMSSKRNKGNSLQDIPKDCKPKNQDKALKFGAYLMFEPTQQTYMKNPFGLIEVRLIDRSDSTKNVLNASADIQVTAAGLKTSKEGDLLIVSKSELIDPLTKSDDIKSVMGQKEWLKDNINQGQCLFGFVTERSKRGPMSLTVKMDSNGFNKFTIEQPAEGGENEESKTAAEVRATSKFYKVYCYLVESLSTTVREYRTLRMSEFLGGFTPIIINPRDSLSLIKKEQKRHPKANFMQGFLRAYERNFNPSQISALCELPKMLEDSLLLVQGPVSVKHSFMCDSYIAWHR